MENLSDYAEIAEK